MKAATLTRYRERLILLIVALVTFAISGRYDLLEELLKFSKRYENLEVDELFTVCVVLVLFQALLLHRRWLALRGAKKDLHRQNLELQTALTEIKQLKGIIPICSSCKQIRDDEGYWHQVESYLSDHSDAQFSHGICPSCMKALYGDLLNATR